MVRKTAVIPGAENRNILLDVSYHLEAAPLLIFVHGFKGFKDWGAHNLLAAYFVKNGFNFLKFNFSHNGTTVAHPEDFEDLPAFGDNTFSKELYDLDRVINYALSGVDFPKPDSIFLLGHSRGGGISTIKAAEDGRIRKLVTWASVSRFNNMWDKNKEDEWRRDGVIYTENARTQQKMPLNIGLLDDLQQNSQRLDILSAAAKIEQPWLICHGDADPGVSISQAQQLKEKNNKAELFVIPQGDHVFGASHPFNSSQLPAHLKLVADRTVEFLKID